MSLLTADTSIETERLVLRRITTTDLPFYARIHADPEVARFLAHGNPRLLDETTAWLDSLLVAYRDRQLGQLAVTLRRDGTLLGRCGVSHLEVEDELQPDGTRFAHYYPSHAPTGKSCVTQQELGYTFDRAAWGNGYAREAAKAIWQYTSSRRPEIDLVSLIHPDNARSIRLATSFGAALVDRTICFGRTFDRYVWPAGNSPSTER
jgi:RimJ/RimL family protein N-acetyltransferase